MKKLVPILDAGHGGVINGVYQTPGKRSPNWDKGVLYEGAFNRWTVNRIMEYLDRKGVPYHHVSPELEDITLPQRVQRANNIYRGHKETYFLSFHANAGGGTGHEQFTSIGNTRSDFIANKFLKEMTISFPDMRMRHDWTDGDADKEANFFVLKNTAMPAVLFEAAFMDHPEDYKKLWSKEFLAEYVKTIGNTIIDIYYNGI